MSDTRILIIDDNENDRFSYKRYIKDENYLISEAEDGESALTLLENNNFDCILLDYILPDITGLEIINRIKHYTKNNHTQIIFLTGHGNERIARTALKNGAYDYVVKNDISSEILVKTITDALQLRQDNILEKIENQNLQEKAYFDELTGLHNRTSIYDHISKAIYNCDRYNRKFGLLFIDLNKFKAINDEFGHIFGDNILRETGKRISNSVRKSDTVSRISGDEFVVLLSDIKNNTDCTAIAENIVNILSEPFNINDFNLYVTASIGITVHPDNNLDTAASIINDADRAMYKAKFSNNYNICLSESNS